MRTLRSASESQLGEICLVRVRVEERLQLARISHADPDQPPVPIRVRVDGLRLVDDLLIDLEALAGERRDQV